MFKDSLSKSSQNLENLRKKDEDKFMIWNTIFY